MATWREFAGNAPEMAAFGAERFSSGVAYLGTLRPDGSPRVHPVTPVLGDALYVFMEPTSPKGKDLLRDGRYTLHSAVEDSDGGGGEFYVRGVATPVTDPAERERAEQAAPYDPAPRYVLFRLGVDYAFQNTYEDGTPQPRRWQG